jgi:hypothetical protein
MFYPGLRPIGSWLLTEDGELHGLTATDLGWRDRETNSLVAYGHRWSDGDAITNT